MLTAMGYELVTRNFRTRYGELDIVAIDADCLVFCEVRARVGRPARAIARAIESIGPAKQLQLRKMAGEWFRLGARPARRTTGTRFDVIAVALAADGRLLTAEHVPNAF
jgi:putative endonuclease